MKECSLQKDNKLPDPKFMS